MKKLLFAITVAILVAGCAGMPTYRHQSIAQLPDRVCWRFGGKVHCPPADGSQLVLPCDSPSAVYERAIPVIPALPAVPAARVVGVITATDASGKPMKVAEVCSQYGCSGVTTPAPIVEYMPYQPPVAIWVQEPPKACPKIPVWGSKLGNGPWGLPSGPRLQR